MLSGAPALAEAQAKIFHDIKLTPERNRDAEANGELRADAKEAADLLKIRAMVERLRAEKKQGISETSRLSRTLQQSRLLCLWKLLLAAQEVRQAVAEIDFELASSHATLESLTSKRDSTIAMLNTLNFAQGGTLGIIKQSLALHRIGQPPRQIISMTGFGDSIVLSSINLLLVPRLFNRRIDAQPNSLSHFFDPDYTPADAQQSYLWKFLQSNIPNSQFQLKRKEILVKHWQDFAHLNPQDKVGLRKLSADPEGDENLNENIRLLNSRLTLLYDLKTHIEEFDGCLFEVHQAITFNDLPTTESTR